MVKAISVYANEAQASLVDGPRLTTKQPPGFLTVVVAVVGSYKLPPGSAQHPLNKYASFLALLSTDKHSRKSHANDKSEEQREGLKNVESRLLGFSHSLSRGRYTHMVRDWNRTRRYCNSEHFCATRRNCSHGPPPSTFPGNKSWTFAAGEASFDAANKGPGCHRSAIMDHGLAPDVTEADRALGALEDLLQAAVAAGLTELKVAVSASDVTACEMIKGKQVVDELQVLTSRVFDAVIGWVERGWVARDQLDVVWCPLVTTRNFGVVGSQDGVPFVIYDEG